MKDQGLGKKLVFCLYASYKPSNFLTLNFQPFRIVFYIIYGTISLARAFEMTGAIKAIRCPTYQDLPMVIKQPENSSTSSNEDYFESWIPTLLPILKSGWHKQFADTPAAQSSPDLNDWLELLNVAATAPWQISDQLSRLFPPPKSSSDLQERWKKLTLMFSLTLEAAESKAGQLEPTTWRTLLQVQNRILSQATRMLQIKQNRPDTGALTRRAFYLQTIIDLNKKIVEIWDPSELLDEVVAIIQKNLGYEYVNLFQVHPTKQELLLQSAIWNNQRPKPEDYITLQIGTRGIVSRVAATGQIVLVNDVAQEPEYVPHPALPDTRAQLAVPLIVGNNLVGVLDLQSTQLHAFVEDDRQIGQALAYHVAVALENARLQADLQRHLREKTLLYESNLALGTSMDMDRVLGLMSQKIAEALEAGACVICRIDQETNMITALAEYTFRYPGNPAHTWRTLNTPLPLSKDPAGQQVLKTGRPVISRLHPDRLSSNLAWSLSTASTNTDPAGKQSWGVLLALPLEIEGRIIGLVELYDKSPQREFSSDDIQLCRILATQTTLAMERARLFNETRRRLNEVSTLYTMAREITENLELQAVLNTIVVTLRQAIGCRGCCIFLLDQTEQYLEIKAADGLKPHWRKMARLGLGQGIAGRAAAEGRAIYIPDTYQEPDFIFFDEEVHSLLAIPLFAHGEIIGVINVDDNHPHAFGPVQERLLSIAATQAGMVIDNARLFSKISREQQRIKAIIQHMADGLLVIDSQGSITNCNPTLAVMLGLHSGQIIGQNVTSPHLHPNLARIVGAPTRSDRTGVLSQEVSIESPQPKTLKIFTTTVVDDDQNPMGEVRVVHDITRERELEQLKDDFFSTISHELRTPLFSIQGFAQILLEEKDLDADTQAEFLSTIRRQAAQLSEMVNNLLDLSKFDETKLELNKEPLLLPDLIHQTILKLQGFAHQRRVRLVSNLAPSLPVVAGDEQRLEQVLTNLIGNAIKFSEAENEVVISAVRTTSQLQVTVKDTGIGIPLEAQEQIFSRYYQIQQKGAHVATGSGLGLHISKKIIEAHGGRIWVESTAGQGSSFHFTLPERDPSK
jgi:PAS domain S-box-containing protein